MNDKTSQRLIQPLNSRLKGRDRSRRGFQRAQSLVEFALTVPILLLIFSGTVDMGRAFFIRITMDSLITEALNYGADNGACLQLGMFVPSPTAPLPAPYNTCDYSNSMFDRMKNEAKQLNIPGSTGSIFSTQIVKYSAPGVLSSPILDYVPNQQQAGNACDNIPTSHNRCKGPSPNGGNLGDLQLGDSVYLCATYTMPVLTPLAQAMFGTSLDIPDCGSEIMRNKQFPKSVGTSEGDEGVTSSVPPVTSGSQGNSAPPPQAQQGYCDKGAATIWWVATFSQYSYELSPYDGAGHIDTNLGPSDSIDFTGYTAGSVVSALVPIDTTMKSGLYQHSFTIASGTYTANQYIVRAYTVDPSTGNKVYSTPLTIQVGCNPVAPQSVTAACDTNGNGIDFNWNMPLNSGNGNYIDQDVNTYGVLVDNLYVRAFSPNPSPVGPTSQAGYYKFGTISTPPNGDWGSHSYEVVALDSSGSAIYGFPSSSITKSCAFQNQNGTTTSNVSISVNDGQSTYVSGALTKYTVTVTNTDLAGSGTDYGLVINTTNPTTPLGALSNPVWWCVSASSGATCSHLGQNSQTTGMINDAIA